MSNGSTYDLFHSTKGRLLASSPSHSEGHPAWSSNGKYIAFASDRTGRGDLYYARFGKAKAKRLTQHSDSTEMFPVWSPTRSLQLAYVRHTEKTDRIHIIDNIFTRRTRRLTRWNQNVAELHPSWSPDGKHIAFFAQHPKRSGFYIGRDKCDLVVSDVSGKVHTLAIDVVKSEAFGPTWSPDGSQIFYVANRGKRAGMIHSISLKTGTIRHFPTKTRANNELAITAHNNRWILAFTSTGRTDDPPRKYRRLHLVSIRPTQSKTN
jgi:Tol biopolymer transport system component